MESIAQPLPVSQPKSWLGDLCLDLGLNHATAKNGLHHRSQDYHATVWPSPALDSHTLQCACLGARPLHAGKFADFLGGEQHHFFFRGVRVMISSSAAQLGSHRSGSVAGFSV